MDSNVGPTVKTNLLAGHGDDDALTPRTKKKEAIRRLATPRAPGQRFLSQGVCRPDPLVALLKREPEKRSDMAWRFRTNCGRILTLSCAFVLGCIASGPVISLPTFAPLLGELHVFNSTANHSSDALNNIANIGVAILGFTALPGGLMYDVLGPALTALIGGLMSAVGLAFMGIGITKPALNWIFACGYPIAVAGGYVGSFGMFSWMFMLPSRQTLIVSLITSAQGISDMLAALSVPLHEELGVPLYYYFAALAVISGCAGTAVCFLAPSRSQNKVNANLCLQALQMEADAAAKGPDDVNMIHRLTSLHVTKAELTKDDHMDTEARTGRCCQKAAQTWRLLKGTFKVFCKFPLDAALVTLYVSSATMQAIYPFTVMYNYFVTFLDSTEDAKTLVSAMAIVYGFASIVGPIGGGYLADFIGLKWFATIVFVAQVVSFGLQFIPYFEAQFAWMVVWALSMSALVVVYMKWCVCYAPQEVFGTTQGFFAFAASIPQVLFVAPMTIIMPKIFGATGLLQFIVPFAVLDTITFLASLAFVIRLFVKPPPKSGMIVLRDGQVVNLEEEEEKNQQESDNA